MADAKLDVKIGGISFVGEGSEKWLSEQLATIIAAAPKLAETVPDKPAAGSGGAVGGGAAATGNAANQTLAARISGSGAGGNQVKRFLVVADWLRLKGQTPLTTKAVAKALKDNHQAKLTNASDCLGQNVGKGLCEKTSDGFFITPEGLKNFGYPAA